MRMAMAVGVLVVMSALEVDVEFYSRDASLVSVGNVQMIPIDLQAGQLSLQRAGVNAQVEQGADEHVAADAAEQIEVESFHSFAASALIWLAA